MELVNVQVTFLRLLLELGLFCLGAHLSPFHLVCQLLLLLLLLHVVDAVLGAGPLSLEHLVDHVLDIAWSGLLFYLGPVLHNGVLKLHEPLILLQSPLVGLWIMLIIVVEDVV